MTSILTGGLTEFTKAMIEHAKIDKSFVSELGLKTPNEINPKIAKNILGADTFENNGEFSLKGRKKFKKIIKDIGLSTQSSVEEYSNRLKFFNDNPIIAQRFEELRECVKWMYGNIASIKKLRKTPQTICLSILKPWSEETLIKNLSSDSSYNKCFSLLNNPGK